MRERFTQDMKTAMKAGDKRRLGTVRLVQAALLAGLHGLFHLGGETFAQHGLSPYFEALER